MFKKFLNLIITRVDIIGQFVLEFGGRNSKCSRAIGVNITANTDSDEVLKMTAAFLTLNSGRSGLECRQDTIGEKLCGQAELF